MTRATAYPSDQTPSSISHLSRFAGRISRKLARSRYFSVSLLVHLVLISLLGSIALVSNPINVGSELTAGGALVQTSAPDAGQPQPTMPEIASPPSPQVPVTPAATATSPIPVITTLSRINTTLPSTASVVTSNVQGLPIRNSGGLSGIANMGLPQKIGTRTTTTNIFGVVDQVANVVFVVDISGSMVTKPKTEDDYKKLEREIGRAVRALDKNTAFGIIAFAGKPLTFREQLVLADPANVEAALKWLREQGPYDDWKSKGAKHTGTAAAAALKLALSFNPDTIFLASDGDPTDLKGQKFLDKISELQSALEEPAKIHTISYKADSKGDLLEQLAKLFGGRHKEIR
jgi:hypothetical protein